MDLDITMATSRQLYKQLQVQLGLDAATAGGYWFYGDPAAFAYMENWPITVVQAPTNSEAEFTPGHRGPLQGQRARRGRGHRAAADHPQPARPPAAAVRPAVWAGKKPGAGSGEQEQGATEY